MTVTLTPNPATPGSTVTVEGTGFTPKIKIRIKDAGDVWRSRADGGFSVGLVVSTTPKTQAVVVQQQVSGAWVTSWSGTVVVQASAPPPPPPPPPSGVVGQFPGSGANTKAAFVAKLADMNIDILEIAAGTYSAWHNVRINVDRSSRPLLVRPAPGAAVLWDVGDTGWGNGLFYFGIDSLASDFTFDPAGTGGSFEIRGFSLRSAGLITTYYARRVKCDSFKVRDCRAKTGGGWESGGQTEWAIYVATDGEHRGSDLTFNNWDFATGSDRKVNFFQCYHTPGADRIVARNNKVNGNVGGGKCHWALVARGDYTGLDISGWTIANVDVPFDSWDGGSGSPGQPTGVVSGMTATGSGAPRLGQIVDGGGNSW